MPALERQAPQVTVAIVARGADMRKRFFARCRELATRVPVDHPRTNEMAAFADGFAKERGRTLCRGRAGLLLECIGRDLMLLASEMDKLAAGVEGQASSVPKTATHHRPRAASTAISRSPTRCCCADAAGATRASSLRPR
jgi:DNA polymerase III delta subunit